MDPITIGLAIGGIATSIFGGMSAAEDARHAAQINKQISAQEQLVNDQKQQAMLVDSRRKQLENIRNVQQAQAMNLQSATTQGAQFGSGLQGGLAQARSQGGWNSLGISNNLEIGKNIFSLDRGITGLKSQLSDVQSSQATNQAIAGIGSTMTASAGTIGKIGQGFNTDTRVQNQGTNYGYTSATYGNGYN